MTYSFGPYRLETQARRLLRDNDVVPMPDRQLGVLLHLVAHAGQVVSKDALIAAAWNDVAVTDNSLEQAISGLRRALGRPASGATSYIETFARRGYRFAVTAAVSASRQSDEELASLLAPYAALVDGRAALETFDRDLIARACAAFEEMTRTSPDYAPAHLGLANAVALGLESMRADGGRDEAALRRALHHASEACRLDPASGEAWATLGLLCHQAREHARAVAAARRAADLEPDNWRHHLRLAYASWGETRLRAAHRVLTLLPEFPYAHWLAATVHVARQALREAEHELIAGADAQDRQHVHARFKGVGLHLVLGLVLLAGDDEDGAVARFERELAAERSRHIYAREVCANAWCALAAVRWRHADRDAARAAVERAIALVPGHAIGLAAAAALSPTGAEAGARPRLDARLTELRAEGASVMAALAEGIFESLTGQPRRAARIIGDALEGSPADSAGWSIPVEPLLQIHAQPDLWRPVLALLRDRAS